MSAVTVRQCGHKMTAVKFWEVNWLRAHKTSIKKDKYLHIIWRNKITNFKQSCH